MTEARTERIEVRLTKSERERIESKMAELGVQNMSAYLRKMALDGYCIRLELDDVRELVRLLRLCSNNLNQYARKANESGRVYSADIQDLQERMAGLWRMTKEILARLASIA